MKLFSILPYMLKESTLWVSSFKTISNYWNELKTEFDLIESQIFVITQINFITLANSWKKFCKINQNIIIILFP